MKKTMSLGDLLNEIKNGTQPKEITIIYYDRHERHEKCVWSEKYQEYERDGETVTTAISKLAANAIVGYEEPPILDDSEKKYLSAVIKPFRNKVKKIAKIGSDAYKDRASIMIYVRDLQTFGLPYFEANDMYTGMETDREYTLEELGL